MNSTPEFLQLVCLFRPVSPIFKCARDKEREESKKFAVNCSTASVCTQGPEKARHRYLGGCPRR
jgi:hypothetical protein